jgi:ribosome-associated protein
MRTTFTIPVSELEFRTSRAGGPGGQHVNKASTRVEVLWDLGATTLLTDPERARVRRILAGRIAGDRLRVVADDRRSLLQNRRAAVARLERLVDEARRAPKPRKATKPTRAARERRLTAKHRRADRKRDRARPGWEE